MAARNGGLSKPSKMSRSGSMDVSRFSSCQLGVRDVGWSLQGSQGPNPGNYAFKYLPTTTLLEVKQTDRQRIFLVAITPGRLYKYEVVKTKSCTFTSPELKLVVALSELSSF
ncbi:uncharacterized protein MCYG_07597 [Microsporum canis CBS 113480]|uniref:Uncharacterized protein n=1 Tax=Arthroderma otae (strain ATCC MYA-4605 / CBS 113480) TaxID=554155 RepID=C5FWT8_ARTOC|nr:uncharacterized protein MCYG_07597 [Microsporum canis CBS 113480]EEQ34778.1 predicted protein [Microsporum canis CBS 113480]